MSESRLPLVSVVGSAICTPAQSEIAETIGRLLAERGAILVCGGRGGVMEAACRGAQEAGGLTIGILPGVDPAEGNPHLTVALPTGLGNARNALVALAGEAVIAIGGGYGTLSEIGIALKQGQRVIGINTWVAVNSDGQDAAITTAQTAKEAVDMALSGHLEEG
jgi:uncharacterized protein (TIGR00725 family)